MEGAIRVDNMIEVFEYKEKDNYSESFSLLIYDIVDNKKRTRFSKFMEGYGTRVQKSAFEVRIDKVKLKKMIDEVGKFVSKEDSIKLYKVRGNTEVICWGKAEFEEKDDYIII